MVDKRSLKFLLLKGTRSAFPAEAAVTLGQLLRLEAFAKPVDPHETFQKEKPSL